MLRATVLVCLLAVAVACGTSPVLTPPAGHDTMLVVVDDPRASRIRNFAPGRSYGAPIAYEQDPILSRYSRLIARDHNQVVLAEWPIRSIGVHCFVIEQPAKAALTAMRADPRIKWIQPFNTHFVQSNRRNTDRAAIQPARLPVSGDGAGSRITVIDTGADLHHQDLRGSRIRYNNFVPEQGAGHQEIHGTSVLGLIAAQPRRQAGVVHGLAPAAALQHLRACWEEGQQGVCNTLTLALALDAAVAWQPDVINLSLSGPSDRVLDALIAELTRKGTVVVSAFDDARPRGQRFPSPGPNIIYAMGGDRLAHHPQLSDTFLAPDHAMSLSPMNNYELASGHSIATPYITALVALTGAGDGSPAGADMPSGSAPSTIIERLLVELSTSQ